MLKMCIGCWSLYMNVLKTENEACIAYPIREHEFIPGC